MGLAVVGQPNYPVGSSSGWRSRERLRVIPQCCFSMSRFQRLIK
jgi:hypothetical protein